MTTLSTTMHVYGVLYEWAGEWNIAVFNSPDMAKISDEKTLYVYIEPVTITAQLPAEREIMQTLVVSLRERQAEVLAEARLAHTKIEERIQSLLAITHELAHDNP